MKHSNIYILDDSLTIRAMLESLIEQDDAFEVCGLAADAEHALDDLAILRPDILLLDLSLPTVDGLAFLARAQKHIDDPWRPLKVIVVSSSTRHEAPICADTFALGALACFDKNCLRSQSTDFMTLLHEVSRGPIGRYNHFGSAVTLPPWCDEDDHAEDEDRWFEGQFEILPTLSDRPGALTFI